MKKENSIIEIVSNEVGCEHAINAIGIQILYIL